jgi:hypothetical protein
MHLDAARPHRPTTSPATTPAPPCPAGRATSTRLNAEWRRLRDRPAAVAAARSWHVTEVPFADLDELLVLAGSGRPTSADADAVLAALVRTARTTPLAGRIVLQRLLPGLLVTARRRRSAHGPDAFEDLVAAAWVAIHTFDLDRRPPCLAASLVWAADNRAFRRRPRHEPVAAHPDEPERLVAPVADPHPLRELAEVVDDARRAGLTDADLELLRRLLADGQRALAADLQVTTRTIRNRRDRLVERLRSAVAA